MSVRLVMAAIITCDSPRSQVMTIRFSRPNCRFSSRLIALVVALALFGAGPSDARPQEGRFRRGDVDGDARVTMICSKDMVP